MGRWATTLGSSNFKVPEVAFRGLGAAFSPAATRAAFMTPKSAKVMYASPRISIHSGGFEVANCSGIERNVRKLAVMSSPKRPSPRVTPRVNLPRR